MQAQTSEPLASQMFHAREYVVVKPANGLMLSSSLLATICPVFVSPGHCYKFTAGDPLDTRDRRARAFFFHSLDCRRARDEKVSVDMAPEPSH